MEDDIIFDDNEKEESKLRALLTSIQADREQKKATGEIPKGKVDSAEYLRRIEANRIKDLALLGNVNKRKADAAAKEWAKKVGPTFAHAKTEIPQVAERVERHRTRQGLHKTSIIFHGNQYGRGKTWAAHAYIKSLVELGIILPGQVFFGTESATLSRIANAGFNRSEEMFEMKRDSHKVFFIDDVGQGYFFKKEHREEVWYELIDHIYTKRLTLVLTTNLEFNENGLGAHIGGRAFDRLRTLVGDDGAIRLSGINKRDAIYQENEQNYREGKRK